MFNRSYNVITG